AGMNWDSARLFGIPLGPAHFEPVLRDGRITVPTSEIPATGGIARLGGIIDFTTAEPTWSAPGRLAMLDNVEIDEVMGEEFLSRINPVFGQLNEVHGRMTLTTQDVWLPLGEAIRTSGGGSGRLDLTGVRASPRGHLGQLLRIGLGPLAGHLIDIRAGG